MAKTTMALLGDANWPSDTMPFYKKENVQITGTMYPGYASYFESDGVVRPALSGTAFGGVIGQSIGQEIDTVYTDQTYNVPHVPVQPHVEVPIYFDNAFTGVALLQGADLSLSTTAGKFSATAETITGATMILNKTIMKLSRPKAAGDIVGYGRFI